jgi:hypothetical protein
MYLFTLEPGTSLSSTILVKVVIYQTWAMNVQTTIKISVAAGALVAHAGNVAESGDQLEASLVK